MEPRWWRMDDLAVPAGKFLADVLDNFPLPWNDLKRLGDILAQFGQAGTAVAGAGGRAWRDHPFARQVFGKGLAGRVFAGEGCDVGGLGDGCLGGQFILGGSSLEVFQLHFQLIQQLGGALGSLAEAVALEYLDLKLEMNDQCVIAGPPCHGDRGFGTRFQQFVQSLDQC